VLNCWCRISSIWSNSASWWWSCHTVRLASSSMQARLKKNLPTHHRIPFSLEDLWFYFPLDLWSRPCSVARLFSFCKIPPCPHSLEGVVVVVLPDPFRGMGVQRNSTETQQSGHAPRSGSEVKNGKSGAEDGAPERTGWETVKEEVSQILQRMSAGAAWRILLPFYPA